MRLPDVSGILCRPVFWLAAVVLVASLFFPRHGFGIPGCGFQILTAQPCPGCGLTRSVACASQLDWSAAWSYHPFVVVVWPAMVVLAAAAFVPALANRLRSGLADERRDRLNRAFWAGLVALILFGGARIAFGSFWVLG